MTAQPCEDAVARSTRRQRSSRAGIDSARYDAEELAAHVVGTERGRLPLVDSPG